MIYFDENKQAYAYETQNYVATTDDETWAIYAGTDKWDIVNGLFIDITTTPEYIAEQEAKNNAIIKQDILKQLSEIDAKSIRALRDGDTAYIAQYKAQAQDLREQLNATV